MELDKGILIATGVLVAMMLMKRRTGSVIVDPLGPGEFPDSPEWDHWPTSTDQVVRDIPGNDIAVVPGNTGIVTPGILPVMIDYIGVFPVSYAATVNGTRPLRRNLGTLRCI